MDIKKSVGTSLAVTLMAAGALVAASPAHAAAGCSGAGPRVTDYAGTTWNTTYCYNYQSGDIGRGSNTAYLKTGYLYAGTNWFACQKRIPDWENPAVGNARNNWWLWTQGDEAVQYGGWGWFPATKVSGGNNYEPVPGLPLCPAQG